MSSVRIDPFRTVVARRLVRKMRGGAQAHLIEADDGEFYVVKFLNNPQHRRVLINEAVGSVLLRHLGLSAPEPALVSVTTKFLRENPDVSLQGVHGRVPVEPGLHFGSRYPGHPDRLAVFDLLPDSLLPKIENLGHFLGMLVFDKWAANTDNRQAVFFRQPDGFRESRSAQGKPFHALMIDHGFLFNGPHWDFSAGPLHGLFPSASAYYTVRSLLDFEPWLGKVARFPEAVIAQLRKSIPAEWICDDVQGLERLLNGLVRRRSRVPELIHDCRLAKLSAFPNWKQNPIPGEGPVAFARATC